MIYDPMLTAEPKHQSSLLGRFQSWRHAGEEGALAMYCKSVGGMCLLLVGGFAVFAFVFPQFIWTIVGIGAAALCYAFAMGRKAIIFTETEVRYRPIFARPRRVPIAKIQVLKRARVLELILWRPVPRPGVILTLADGTTEAWPLDFEGPGEILQRLSALAGKEIQ
jgi:hypothetical protein